MLSGEPCADFQLYYAKTSASKPPQQLSSLGHLCVPGTYYHTQSRHSCAVQPELQDVLCHL